MSSSPPIGVLALQGATEPHLRALRSLGCDAQPVIAPEQLARVRAIVLPGGESTTMSKLLDLNGLREGLTARLAEGMPAFGTCAGLILLAGDVIDGRPDQVSLDVLDVSVRRNAFGRQTASFEADLTIDAVGPPPLHAVFIRAPWVERTGDGVEVLATVDDHPVLVRQGAVLASSFHPELTDDRRLHELFIRMIADVTGDPAPGNVAAAERPD